MRNRFLTIGLVLSLSNLLCGPGWAGDPPAGPDPEEACHSLSVPWTLACVCLAHPERLPPRDPWTLLQSTPGVLVDRITVGGRESGCSSGEPMVEAGASVGQGFLGIDEMLATDMAVAGVLPDELDFNAFAELPWDGLKTAGPGSREVSPRLRPRRGTNEWRAMASALGNGGEAGSGEGDRVDALRAANAWIGGPLSRDRFWVWGEAGLHQVDRTVLGGQREERSGDSGRFKLNQQLGNHVSAVLAGSRGRSAGSGIGAGPGRAPETTWKESGREEVWAAEGAVIVTSDLFFSMNLGRSDRHLGDRPRLAGPEARIDADGVARGSWFDLRESQQAEQARLLVDLFGNTGSTAHEITLGAGWRGQEETQGAVPPGPLVTDGGTAGLADGLALAELWRAGRAEARTHTLGLWMQDTIAAGDWTTIVGLQADRQELGFAGGRPPWTLLPRFEVNRSLGSSRKTQVWIALSRFASRLSPRAAWHLDPGAPALLRGIFEDRDADLSLDPGEPIRLLPGEGIDPLRPGLDPDAVDSGLRPETTDEIALGAQSLVTPSFQIGLRAIWRRTGDLLEERLLVRNLATQEVFLATAGDWVPVHRLTGALPDGTAYDVPVWDLRPGLLWTGGTRLVNGDRRQEVLGLTFTWQKRLGDGWMTQGHLTWQDGHQRLGPAFRRFDDPTNTLGGGDDEGQPVAEIDSGHPHELPGFLASRWSFHALGFVVLRDGLNLSAAVSARQGQPLPYYRQVARERAGLALVQLTDRPDSLRTETLFTLDARLEKEIQVDDVNLTLSLEAANLLNARTVLARELDLGTGRAARGDETLASRTLRLQVRMFWR